MCSPLHSKFLPYASSFKPQDNPMRKMLSLIPFYRKVKSNLLKATGLISGGAEPSTQAGGPGNHGG